MLAGPSKIRELFRFRASFSFQRASMSAALQNIVLSVASVGCGSCAVSGLVRTRPSVSKRISHPRNPCMLVK